MSEPSRPPAVADVGPQAAGVPAARLRVVPVVAVGLACLVLGYVLGGGGSTESPEPGRSTASQVQARVEERVDALVGSAVKDAVAAERSNALDELSAIQAALTATEERLARARADLRRTREAAAVSEQEAVAAAIVRTRREMRSRYGSAQARLAPSSTARTTGR